MSGPPPNARRGRQQTLIGALNVAVAAVGALAMLALLLPGSAGTNVAWVVIAIVVAAPLVRVGWLAIRWSRLGDHRFAAVAIALLLVVAGGSTFAI